MTTVPYSFEIATLARCEKFMYSTSPSAIRRVATSTALMAAAPNPDVISLMPFCGA